jgi:hypothetical protein
MRTEQIPPLRHPHLKAHAQRRSHAEQRPDSRIALGHERLVQVLAAKAGITRHAAHAARAGNIAQCRQQKPRIVVAQRLVQVGSDGAVALQVARGVEGKLCALRNCADVPPASSDLPLALATVRGIIRRS